MGERTSVIWPAGHDKAHRPPLVHTRKRGEEAGYRPFERRFPQRTATTNVSIIYCTHGVHLKLYNPKISKCHLKLVVDRFKCAIEFISL